MNKYPIPDALNDLFAEQLGCIDCRNKAINGPLWYHKKRALWFATKARKLTAQFWVEVYKLYPALEGEHLSYSPETKIVTLYQPPQDKQEPPETPA